MAKKKKSAHSESAEPQATFEESLEQLEQIVRQLEDGELGLTDSLQRYEDGVKHLKQCYTALEAAERKITLLTGVTEDGLAVTEPFDDEELSIEEKSAKRGKRRTSSPPKDSGASDIDANGGLF